MELEAREGNPSARLQVEEKKLAKRVELIAHGVAKRLGYETVPWFQLTQFVLAIYLTLTVLSMFFRPDFFNVCIVTCITSIVDYLCCRHLYDRRHRQNQKRYI